MITKSGETPPGDGKLSLQLRNSPVGCSCSVLVPLLGLPQILQLGNRVLHFVLWAGNRIQGQSRLGDFDFASVYCSLDAKLAPAVTNSKGTQFDMSRRLASRI